MPESLEPFRDKKLKLERELAAFDRGIMPAEIKAGR
jgi:hypothetical protein